MHIISTGEKMVKTDDGFNQAKQQLPFTEMTFLQNDDNVGFANMTLGPLQCWGNGIRFTRISPVISDIEIEKTEDCRMTNMVERN